MKRFASAQWQGNLKSGKGQVSTESGCLNGMPVSFRTRFESGGQGTNPEELIAAAHASCFSMALSHELEQMHLTPDWIETQARLNFEMEGSGWLVTGIHLEVSARVPGARLHQFEKAAAAAKTGCPVSKLLKTEITLETRLDQAEANRDAEMDF